MVLHLRLAGDLESHFISIIAKGRPRSDGSTRGHLVGSERIKVGSRAEASVSLAMPQNSVETRAAEEMEPTEA